MQIWIIASSGIRGAFRPDQDSSAGCTYVSELMFTLGLEMHIHNSNTEDRTQDIEFQAHRTNL